MMEGESCSLPSGKKLKIHRHAKEAGGEPQPFPLWAIHSSKEDGGASKRLILCLQHDVHNSAYGVLELTQVQERSMTGF